MHVQSSPPQVIEFIMVRHADHINPEKGITGGDKHIRDPKLTEKGEDDARLLGEKINRIFPEVYHEVYHSGLARTEQTARLAFEGKEVTFIEIPDFREICHRATEKMDPKKRNEMWDLYISAELEKHEGKEIDPKFKYDKHPSDGETYEELFTRVDAALKSLGSKLAEQNVTKPVFIFTHNAAMQVLMAYRQIETGEMKENEYYKKTGLYPMFFDGSLLDNCSMIKVRYFPERDEAKYVEKVIEPIQG